MEAVIFWSDCDLKYDLVRESQGFFSCLAAGNPARDGCHGALDIHDSILKCISMNKKLSIEENFILMIEKFCIIFFLFKFHFSQIALAQDQVFCW